MNGNKILVADDEGTYRFLVADALERCGVRRGDIIQAEDGEQAIQLIRQNRDELGLIISDLDMPIANGIKVLLWCKGHEPKIPVVIMSNDFGGKFPSPHEILKFGANVVIDKLSTDEELPKLLKGLSWFEPVSA